MAFIEVEHLKYRYPHTEKLALDDLNFTLERGEFIGILGENGAGKSTLSQAFMGLVPQFYKGAYGGRVLVDGMEAGKTPIAELCRKVGLVFQNPFNQLSGAKDTVYEEIAFGLQNLAVPREEMKERIDKVMELLDIAAYRDRNPFDLSGGQMQRVAIASILVMQPEAIILDEPTSQLDPQGAEEVFRAVDALAGCGITILMIEQKVEKLAAYCNRILLLHQGKQIDFDTPGKIFSRTDLEDYGVLPPAFTRICHNMGIRKKDGTYPATLEEVCLLREEYKENPLFAGKLTAKSGLHKTEMQKETEILRAEHLDFHYTEGTPILENLSLSLDGRPTAIIGQNGAGKTTFVKLLKGLLKPVAGHIYLKGKDTAERTVAQAAGEVGYVFQNPDDQIFKYNVLDEVMFGPLNIGMTKQEAQEHAREALKLVGLEGTEKENPYDLELYERKMVAIASVLAMDTDVVILDEPTIAQDYRGRETIRRIIQILKEQGKLVIAILHDMDFVAESFERVIVMAHGKILADGRPEEVFSREDALEKARLTKPHVTQLMQELGYEEVFLQPDNSHKGLA